MKMIAAVLRRALVGACLLGISQGNDEQSPLSANHESKFPDCIPHHYNVHLVSKSPLVVYLENFITADERAHLQHLAEGHFKHSGVADASGNAAIHAVRTSQSTSVERDDVVRCIEQRALLFQGFDIPESHVEPIQLVKYAPTERYHFHTDWFLDPARAAASGGGNRESSFFGYIKVHNVTGGGTNFPLLDAPRSEKWCEKFLDCDQEYDAGVTFRPVEGNAIYWSNMLADGTGDQRTLHAGLPVVAGEKIGMNIWTRQAPLPPEIRGE